MDYESLRQISIAVADLLATDWLGSDAGGFIALWIACWWFLRAGCQLHLGHRRGDWLVLAWFSLQGFLHVVAVTQ